MITIEQITAGIYAKDSGFDVLIESPLITDLGLKDAEVLIRNLRDTAVAFIVASIDIKKVKTISDLDEVVNYKYAKLGEIMIAAVS